MIAKTVKILRKMQYICMHFVKFHQPSSMNINENNGRNMYKFFRHTNFKNQHFSTRIESVQLTMMVDIVILVYFYILYKCISLASLLAWRAHYLKYINVRMDHYHKYIYLSVRSREAYVLESHDRIMNECLNDFKNR